MKEIKIIILTAICMTSSYTFAQDLIVKKDGSVIQAKVTKVGTSEVEYKKWSNPDGPQYSITIADILAINYKNGDKETFDNVSASRNSQAAKTQTEGQQNVIQIQTEDLSHETKVANDEMIAKLNEPVELLINEKDKKDIGKKEVSSAIACFGASPKSVLCDGNIAIMVETGELYKETSKRPAEWINGGLSSRNRNLGSQAKYVINPAIRFHVYNNSNQTLYIDLANTFYVNMGNSQTYYVPSSTTTSKTSSGGAGVNLGAVTGALGIGGAAGTLANGINVGGGSSSTTTNTIYSQRIIALAPKSITTLAPKYFFGETTSWQPPTDGIRYDLWQNYTYLRYVTINFSSKSEKGAMMFGDHYTYNEDKSPIQFSFYLSYSKEETCANTITLPSTFYLKDLIGRNGANDKPTNTTLCFGFSVTNNNGTSFPRF